MADRVQLQRTKGWRMPAETVKVDRSTSWGNPWPVGAPGPDGRVAPDAQGAVGLFEDMLADAEKRLDVGYPDPSTIRNQLGGKNLACWCRAGYPCHADVLLRIAN